MTWPCSVRRHRGTGSLNMTAPRRPAAAADLSAAEVKKLSPLLGTDSLRTRRAISALSR
ncbi:hypothetical protein PYK79_17435 [Streptomyces sp. ID05-04B]|nr:hypothetical protein [Streptomyces sp. ID05-04B]